MNQPEKLKQEKVQHYVNSNILSFDLHCDTHDMNLISDTYILSDCDLYTTCEPCPMCFGAIYWSRVKAVYFGARRDDAAKVGFDDSLIYEEIKQEIEDDTRKIPFTEVARVTALKVFEEWATNQEKVMYEDYT